jgi:hypothetical protein
MLVMITFGDENDISRFIPLYCAGIIICKLTIKDISCMSFQTPIRFNKSVRELDKPDLLVITDQRF